MQPANRQEAALQNESFAAFQDEQRKDLMHEENAVNTKSDRLPTGFYWHIRRQKPKGGQYICNAL